jgi:hypothetical protein
MRDLTAGAMNWSRTGFWVFAFEQPFPESEAFAARIGPGMLRIF